MKISLTGRGLALIVVVGILGVLAALAVAFVAMAQLERRASEQRLNGARAYLLARSGIEDALARLELGQDPAYGGENWDADSGGILSAFEADQEIYHRTGAGTPADIESCPVRQTMRPSFFARVLPSQSPATLAVEGRQRGYSGVLAGDYGRWGNTYALKVSSSNAGIYINGGALDALDRDPDGPGATAADFPLNSAAATEVAPLKPNGKPDHMDASMEGPNGFLVRLLNNLDAVVTNEAISNLGAQVVEARPAGGYQSLDALKPILGQARFDRFKSYLTLRAWVDPKVIKPQPMDGRPHRWEDIDDAHRVGTEAKEISGVHADPTPFTRAVFGVPATTPTPRLTLNPGIRGNGKEAPPEAAAVPWTPLDPTVQGTLGRDGPWTQTITATNTLEGPKTYPIRWERAFVYAASQLRPAPIALEPRSPVGLNTATEEVLASVFLGLKGTYLEVWEGSAGWEGGFGWYNGTFGYPYPSQATEDTPWIRTRVDYGMTYGDSVFAPPGRPWYGPADYDPHHVSSLQVSTISTSGSSLETISTINNSGLSLVSTISTSGSSLVQSAPLGRLKETPPLTPAQALSGAHQARQAITDLGSPARMRTWAQVNAFLDALPRWEDVNEDGLLDGPPYGVLGNGGAYVRRMYLREDTNSDFILQREIFTPKAGTSWKDGSMAWEDPGRPKSSSNPLVSMVNPPLDPNQVPGLTFLQKDVLKAMINPNTDLNDFNPDGNLWKELDKTDLAGIKADPSSYAHTTELSLEDGAGVAKVQAVGRVTTSGGKLLAQRLLGAAVSLGEVYRDSTQADFMRDYHVSDEALRAEASEREEYEEFKVERERTQAQEMPQRRAEYKAKRKALYKSWGGSEQYSEDAAELDAQSWESAYPEQRDRSNMEEDAKAEAGRQAWRKALRDIFRGPPSPGSRPVSGDQPLLSYPEPQTTAGGAKAAGADYDGQISLGFISVLPSAEDYLRGDLFNTADADMGPKAVPDLRGPRQGPLLTPAGRGTGNVFPDGVYSEKDRALKFLPPVELINYLFIECWAKPAWFPEASPRAHALVSVSQGSGKWGGVGYYSAVPLGDVEAFPSGLYFVPARNNFWQGASGVYAHTASGTQGKGWPCRSLLWGTVHAFWATDAVNRRGILEAPAGTHPVGRLEAHRWVHLAMQLILNQSGNGWNSAHGVQWFPSHSDGTDNHIRFGEIASGNNMNYAADATFANVRVARTAPYNMFGSTLVGGVSPYDIRATPGRYYKEGGNTDAGATYTAPPLPAGLHPRRVTWTEIPCDLWFDKSGDGWLGDPRDTGLVKVPDVMGVHVAVAVGSVGLLNDQFGPLGAPIPNGKRDVHIELEIWDALGTADPKDDLRLARFDNPAADNRIPQPKGRLYYKAVFVNEWDPTTRANYPLDVTPFLDDVTLTYADGAGPKVLAYDDGDE